MRLSTDPTASVRGVAASARGLTTHAQAGLLAALCSASLVATPLPALAAASLNEVIVEVSETSYPIIKSLKAETFGPFCDKIGNLLLSIKPDKLGKSIELGVDVFTSLPPEKIDAFSATVKDAFANEKVDSCTLVPLPPASLADRFKAVATEKVDASKLKEFDDKWGPTLGALAKTDSAICLPPVATLDKLALSQAELGRAFDPTAAGRFGTYVGPVLKSTFTIGKVLPLLTDAKQLAITATPAEKAAFQAAGKSVEAAAKREAAAAKTEQLKARSAAIAAAKAAGIAAPTETKPPSVLAEEMAAAREAAAKEAAAKKEAILQEQAAKKEALKEAELARVAALKAKSAAIAAAKASAAAP